MADQRLRALRGATTATADEGRAIVDATERLLAEMIGRNGIATEDLVSMIFTTTSDLSAEFPAAAARALGLSSVPLLCAREIDVPGSVPRCIRVLMHLYTTRGDETLRHVYLEGAEQLRTDLLE
ncbi:MAG TPA: chorismate mutase [Actinomycetota bacterium]|nr:chorismate mutase [Actinomycetota bacterium]